MSIQLLTKQDMSSVETMRSQRIKESGIVSKAKHDIEERAILQLISDYEGATPERLNRVRSEIIKSSQGMDEYTIDFRTRALDIINDYSGFDEVQADALETNISETVHQGTEKLRDTISRSSYSSDEQSFFNDFLSFMQGKIESLPISHSLSIAEINTDGDRMHEMGATILDATTDFIQKNMSRIPSKECEGFAKFNEELTAAKKHIALQAYSSELSAPYLPETMKKLDRAHMTQIIRKIVLAQKKCADVLPVPVLTKGSSRSISYAIKKDGQLRGYLCGTAHHLLAIPGGKKLTEITPEMQTRLYQCALLGTEVRFPKDELLMPSNSIDETLIEKASSRGIPHLGIDAEDRGGFNLSLVLENAKKVIEKTSSRGIPHLGIVAEDRGGFNLSLDLENAKKVSDEAFQETMFNVQEQVQAIYRGDIDTYRDSLEKRTSTSSELEDTMSLRNQEMADNIDVLLNACETVGKDLKETPPKAFFAVGIEHIVSTTKNPLSVAELLAKKGWTVELLSPSK